MLSIKFSMEFNEEIYKKQKQVYASH